MRKSADSPASPCSSADLPGHGIRVLVLFGGVPFWGQERANLTVFDALKPFGVEALFITHAELGYVHIEPQLAVRGFSWVGLHYVGRISKHTRLKGWLQIGGRILRSSWRLWWLARQFRPTHIHVCNPDHFLSFLPLLLCSRLPLVYRIGDEAQKHHPLYRLLWRVILWRVDAFVCISEFIRKDLLSIGARPEKLHVRYSTAPLRFIKQPFVAPPTPMDAIRLAFIGQLTQPKGLDLLVNAAMKLATRQPKLQLLIAGDYAWENPYAQALREQVATAGLTAQIIFLGPVEDVHGLLSHCHLHVCPSVWDEPLGLVVMEAKTAGRPSIVFPSGGLPELIRHGVDGWICTARTEAALTSILVTALAAPQQLAAMGAMARASLQALGSENFARDCLQTFQNTSVTCP